MGWAQTIRLRSVAQLHESLAKCVAVQVSTFCALANNCLHGLDGGLRCAISLRIMRAAHVMNDVPLLTKGGKPVRFKLRVTITCQFHWHTNINHPIRSKAVAHPTSFAPASPTEVEQAAKKDSELSRKSVDDYNLHAKELPVLDLQTSVQVQDPLTKRWLLVYRVL